ncbi:flagellar biosynthetic protein FliR [Hydrogenivirga caldilitoris]|uniref:Flagellar biosynthetic protein FliR n=1 Tax=Hydrogenivirga caldilitoris TaxID=246264 RepID=A0A497XWJ9_9AQUI|nr:flagellar biosynthetic protein FliR [Hydrogenivirga caldilitoris]RLJ71532.1 flagellar biosynthetic protein FliR [Hydrogenivirga caldilitoris]
MITLDTNSLLTISLLFFRVFAFVVMVPFFGTFFLPNFVRAYLSFAIAVSIFMLSDLKPIEINSVAEFLKLSLQEALFGFLAGFFLRLLFDSIFVAGEVIAVNTGLGFLMMFLPQQPQTTVLAGFSTLLASTLFLTLGGAEAVYVGLVKSLQGFPLGSFDLYLLNGKALLNLFYSSFSTGVKLALPVLIASLLTNVILAVVNRFIPQINVFMVGLPLQITVGLVILLLSLPIIGLVLISHMREYMFNFLRFMGSG